MTQSNNEKEVRIRITVDPHKELAKLMVKFSKISGEDRALAIGIMSLLHLQLKKVLHPIFRKENKPLEKDSLLGPNRPLGDFENTCLAAYRLNKIPKIIFDDLKILNRIRNKFAHDTKITFDSPSVKDSLKTLKILNAHDDPSVHLKKCNKALSKELDLKGLKLDFVWVSSWISLIIEESNKISLFTHGEVMYLILQEFQNEYRKTIESWWNQLRKNIQEHASTLAKALQGIDKHVKR